MFLLRCTQFYYLVFGVTASTITSSCTFRIFPKITKIESVSGLPPIKVDSLGEFKIVTLSTLDRIIFESRDFNKAKVTNSFDSKTFDRMLRIIKRNENSRMSLFKYAGSGNNDSIYMGVMNPYFSDNFNESQMQTISFNEKTKSGIYLIITQILRIVSGIPSPMSGGSGGARTFTKTYYEFMNVYEGKIVAYSGYCLFADASFRRKNPFPLKRDLKKIGRRLLKDGKK